MHKTRAYSAQGASSPLELTTIMRRDVTSSDVQIEILFCGICHSDLHMVRNEWGGSTVYPIVPGHEIVGRVTNVGSDVTKFKAGDLVGVGCLVDSDGTCKQCKAGYENNCPNLVLTYNGPDRHLGGVTYGGYSESIVVDERFVLHIPANLDLAGTAPLLCAGITTYSPMRHWGVSEGKKVGIVGLGGLGHMGVKFGRAFGAHVVVFTTSPNKKDDALRLGAHEVVVSRNVDEMKQHANSFDFILDTVSAQHDIDAYLELLAPDGGIRETQEMLDFCGEHNITADVEVIGVDDINDAYERVLNADVKYRFSIDMATLKASLQRGEDADALDRLNV
jgi:alcohol dehydrogenase (NADP+)